MSTLKKLTSSALLAATALWASGALFVPVASAQSVAELQAQIAALLAAFQQLQAQLQAAQGGGQGSSLPLGGYSSFGGYNFTRDLTVGSKGDDVSALQQILIDGGYLKIAAPTGYFGSLTKSALAAWQKANGISPASGYFGPKSRAYLASLFYLPPLPPLPPTPGEGGSEVVVPAGVDLYVSLASDSPSAGVLGSGTSFNPVLKVVLTAGSKDVKVTSLRISKSGFAPNSYVAGVDVVDSAGVRHGNVVSSVGADNDVLVLMTNNPVVVKAGKSEKLTVRVNLSSSATSGTLSFLLKNAAAVTADTTAVDGSFPVSGATFTLASASSIAAVSLAVQPVNSSGATLNVDSANWQEITKFRLQETSSNEAVQLLKWTLYNYGNASASDYGDVQLVAQDGTVLATAQPVGQEVVFDLSSSPYELAKGTTKDFTVRAKLLGGTTKTIQLVTYNDYDVVLKGKESQVTILPSAVAPDNTFPVGDQTNYNKVTIGQGSLVFNKAADSPTAATVPGASNVVLAKYYIKPTGEDMELRQIRFGINQTTALTGTVYVKVNDSIVYSAAASSFATDGSANTITLSTYPVLTAGQNSYLTVEASISSSAGSSDSYFVNDMDLLQVKRLISNDLMDPGTSPTDGNTIAVKAAALAVTTLSVPVAASVVAGTNDFEFARFQLDASAGGEDVRVTRIVVTDTLGGGTDYSGVNNLVMYKDGQPLSTSASTAVNANTVAFNFTTPITVTRSSPVTLSLKANVVSNVGNSHRFYIAASGDVTATGVSTGNSVTPTVSGNGQTMTVANSGSLALSLVSGSGASPTENRLVTIGSTDQTVFAFKLTALYEPVKVSSLKLTWSGSSLGTNDVRNIRLYKGSETTPFAQAAQAASCASNTCSFTWNWPDNWGAGNVDPSSPMTVYVKADIGGQGEAKLGNNFVFSVASTSDVVARGAVSGASITPSGTPAATGYSYIVPFSVVVAGDSPSAGSSQTQTVTAGTTIGRFKVTNNGSAKVTLTAIKFTDNGSNSTTTEVYGLYASDENSSNYTGTLLATSTDSVDFGTSLSLTLNGGTYRYLTVTVHSNASGLQAGNSWNLAVASLGDLKYSVADSDLGYDGNVDGNPTSGTSANLRVDGRPVLGTIVKQ